MLLAEKSSDVHQDWSRFVDEVIQKLLSLFNVINEMNLEYMPVIMDNIRYSVKVEYDKDSEEYVATMNDFWFVEAGKTEGIAVQKLADQLSDFSIDYYKDINIYHSTKDFKKVFPRVLKALIIDDTKRIIDSFDIEYDRT